MSNAFTVVIPARYASTRLPGKPLQDIAGKPMIQHVWEQARRSGAAEVLVATDDRRIADAARRHGFEAVLTARGHASGTDRIAEVVARRRYPGTHIVVNVQGDEPLIEPSLIRRVASLTREEGGAYLRLAVDTDNIAAHAFYERLGIARYPADRIHAAYDDAFLALCGDGVS